MPTTIVMFTSCDRCSILVVLSTVYLALPRAPFSQVYESKNPQEATARRACYARVMLGIAVLTRPFSGAC